MAIKIDDKIVSYKDLKKINKPNKKEIKKSLIGKEVYWIEKFGSYDLYVGTIIKENLPKLTIDCYNRNKNKNPNYKKEIIEKYINEIKFE